MKPTTKTSHYIMNVFFIVLLFLATSCGNEIEPIIYEYGDDPDTEEVEDGEKEEETETEEESDEDVVEDTTVSTSLKAFPTAYGAGAYVSGGRGGRVIQVTRLDDAVDSSGDPLEGTFRYALTRQETRIIVFRVSGTIVIGDRDGDGVAESNTMLAIENYAGRNFSNFTVAGQTAPEGGITIKGHIYTDRVENMMWRYIRIRHGEQFTGFDCLTMGNTRQVMIDHLSLSYGSDQTISLANNTNGQFPSTEVTIQNCLLSEGKTGCILGAITRPDLGGEMSFNNNFITNISHRFPNTAADGNYEVINNLIYNWVYRLVNVIDKPKLNHINNAYVGGPKTHVYYNVGNYDDISNKVSLHVDLRTLDAEIYTAGNYISDFLTDPNADNWFTWSVFYPGNGYNENDPAPNEMQVFDQHPLLGDPITVRSADEILDEVPYETGSFKTLDASGNVIEYRDSFDTDKIDEYFSLSGPSGAYGSEPFVYPSIPSNQAYTDTDADGMPDVWETAMGLDPNTKDDKGDLDGDGYTNIEEFLNLVDVD